MGTAGYLSDEARRPAEPLVLDGARTGPRRKVGPVTHVFAPGVTAVLGPNGAGKSTLLLMASGHLPLTGGSVQLGARVLAARDRQSTVAIATQSATLPAAFTVAETIEYAAWLRGAPRSRVVTVVDEFGLESLADRRTTRLSGGERQRVALAVSLLADPPVLLLDEPSAGLDPDARDQLGAVIRAWARDRVVVLTTHVADDVAAADFVAVLGDGRLRWTGSLESFTGAPGQRLSVADAYRRRMSVAVGHSDASPGAPEGRR